MKKKPARKPRTIEVVEDAPVETAEKVTKGKAKAASKAKAVSEAKPAPTAALEAPVEPPTPAPEKNATDAKPAANKRKTKPEPATKAKRNREQPSTEKKLSALDAAAQVLASAGPMNCKSLIEAMASQGLWTSPGGKTPHATLYAAILREITTKGDESRFVKKERGLFAKR